MRYFEEHETKANSLYFKVDKISVGLTRKSPYGAVFFDSLWEWGGNTIVIGQERSFIVERRCFWCSFQEIPQVPFYCQCRRDVTHFVYPLLHSFL